MYAHQTLGCHRGCLALSMYLLQTRHSFQSSGLSWFTEGIHTCQAPGSGLQLLTSVAVALTGSTELGLSVSLSEPQFTGLSNCLEKRHEKKIEGLGRICFTTFQHLEHFRKQGIEVPCTRPLHLCDGWWWCRRGQRHWSNFLKVRVS